MSDDYADAVMRLGDDVDNACAIAARRGLTAKEIADALRLIADEVEEEG